VIRNFCLFLKERNINLLSELEASANAGLVTLYKNARMESIVKLKQSSGGTSIALDVAILHALFAYAVNEKLMTRNPISLAKHAKPGKNPKRPARPFTADEMALLRKHAGKDTLSLLVLRWTGLRVGDAFKLTWDQVHFDRGANGEIEVMTQKRGKKAIIPLSSELRDTLDARRSETKSDFVLENPETKLPYTSRYRLYSRMKALGKRAGVKRVTPHCFRDTFVCDMLARGVGIFDVASMVADTVETIETHYAQFVVAARNAAQHKMDSGIGIEEQGKINQQRGKKVVAVPFPLESKIAPLESQKQSKSPINWRVSL
jgi:integrase